MQYKKHQNDNRFILYAVLCILYIISGTKNEKSYA